MAWHHDKIEIKLGQNEFYSLFKIQHSTHNTRELKNNRENSAQFWWDHTTLAFFSSAQFNKRIIFFNFHSQCFCALDITPVKFIVCRFISRWAHRILKSFLSLSLPFPKNANNNDCNRKAATEWRHAKNSREEGGKKDKILDEKTITTE